MNPLTLVFLLCSSILASWGVTALVLARAEKLRLMQAPNHRSSHTRPTPHGGGLGIVAAGSLVGAGIFFWSGWTPGWVLLALAFFLAAAGLLDDIRHLPAWVRFTLHVMMCGGLLLTIGGLPRTDLSAGIPLIGWVLSGILILAGVWWINLFNFMDGIDGIAGAQAIFMLLAGAGLAAWSHPDVFSTPHPAWPWMLCVAGATLGFLLLNWPPAKIFMGDVGSTWLAFVIFALALISVHTGWLTYTVWLALGALFISDATVTLFTRMIRKERWHEAHRSHAYQRLARQWAGHLPVTLLAIAVNCLWLAPLAWASVHWPEWSGRCLILAYAPLTAGALLLGAGRPDNA